MWKQFLHEYLSFTKRERKGIFIVIALIIACMLFPYLYHWLVKPKTYDHSPFDKEISKLKIIRTDSAINKKNYDKTFDDGNYTNYQEVPKKNYYTTPKSEVFYFDPNSASVEDWKRLGIKERTAETVQKYLSKGGHFYKPEDIRKIWGLHKQDADRLLPYIRIENIKKEYVNDKNGFKYNNSLLKQPSQQMVDINASDTTAFISLPGIGSKLAQRIINFREKLGGFYSVEQVKETYGLPDSTFVKIKPKLIIHDTSVRRININSASFEELKSHPYIKYNIANAIIQYRTQHGNFSSVTDIKKLMIVTDDIFNNILPYLTVN